MPADDLRTAVRGSVLLPGDDGFAQACRAWNLTVDQPVAAVVEAADADDVAALVRCARRRGLSVAAQPNGHGASGDTDGVILLRTGRLDGVEADPERRTARIGAGARWEQVQRAASPHGLTGLAGSMPRINVVGYTLGGGLSWFGRRHGWACDAVRAFDIVDADGDRARVSAEENPDLWWALRGGGGDFAVVTAVEVELYPAPGLYGGRVVWPGERTAEVFEAFVEITGNAPRELSVWFQRFQLPEAPPVVAVDAAYLGDPQEGRAALARLDKIGGALADTRAVLPVERLGDITAEPTDPTPGLGHTELLTGLDAETARALTDGPVAPLVNIQVRHLGGALAEPRPGAGARGPLTEPYLVHLLGLGLPRLRQAVASRRAELVEALGARAGGPKPYTFLVPGERAADAFDAQTLERLRAVKRSRDPHGVFRANFSVLR
ncbi:FAD-binding oxidoreductase [Thermobifida halotolerans]|uniref:FAD-binding oxidoreductase n=1 Tax=Thermobifida halotolerans TaxID=483545 RepID=A0AA97LZJ1_9ACTN|nr:FAD-binding oxidoreductase [Thermobifida halotolerans]UOE20989.1 FAD-binding oxidoreductase [Thermobifida halotolerans]